MSEQMNPEGSIPEGSPVQTPEAQDGSPWIKMIPKAIADQNTDVFNRYESFDGFVTGSLDAMKEAENLRKFDGATVLPGEDADEATWSNAWSKLGKPEAKDGYGIEEDALAEIFYKANLTKAQADILANGLVEYSDTSQDTFDEEQQKEYTEAIESLKGKYGPDLEMKMASAHTAMTNLGGQGLVETLQDKGLDNDPAMIEFFVNVGTLMQEGNIPVGHRLAPKPKGFIGSYDTMKGLD